MIKLSEIAEIKAGYPFRGSVRPDPAGDALVVQMRDLRVTHNAIDWTDVIRTGLPNKREPDWVRPGDILMPSVGGRSQPVLVGEVPDAAVCSPHIFVIRVRPGAAEPGFIAWALKQADAQRQIAGTATGGTVKILRRSVLEEMCLPLPPLAVQKQIAALIDSAHEERLALERLIANREQQLAGIAHNLFNSKLLQEVVK